MVTIMAMSHVNCDHPATPAGRAACRKRSAGIQGVAERTARTLSGDMPQPADRPGKVRTTVRGGRVTTEPAKTRTRTLKAPHDLADVPAPFGAVIRHAWKQGWAVKTGDPYNDTERRIVITSHSRELSLVWRATTPFGVHGVFMRPLSSSVTQKLDTLNEALSYMNQSNPTK
jgi:hypothetical protein